MDFTPNTKETKAGIGKGCGKCGYNVFEAEKLIAAGRVNMALLIRSSSFY